MSKKPLPIGTRVAWGSEKNREEDKRFGTVSDPDAPDGQPFKGHRPDHDLVWVKYDHPVHVEAHREAHPYESYGDEPATVIYRDVPAKTVTGSWFGVDSLTVLDEKTETKTRWGRNIIEIREEDGAGNIDKKMVDTTPYDKILPRGTTFTPGMF